jgi:hypothetical protein
MNWSTTIRELADRGELHGERLLTAVMARETVYMPSSLAAERLLQHGVLPRTLPTQYAGIPVRDAAYSD